MSAVRGCKIFSIKKNQSIYISKLFYKPEYTQLNKNKNTIYLNTCLDLYFIIVSI